MVAQAWCNQVAQVRHSALGPVFVCCKHLRIRGSAAARTSEPGDDCPANPVIAPGLRVERIQRLLSLARE
jgi:hypothetical protein